MIILIFSTPEGVANRTILKSVLPALSDHQVEIYHSLQKLSDRLRQPLENEMLGLFIAASQEELSQLLSIRFLLRHIRIVLILPDRSEPVISKGHGLHPRYIGYVDGNVEEVTAVLTNMIARNRKKPEFSSESIILGEQGQGGG